MSKLLVTGGSGLLGTQLRAAAQGSFDCIATYHTHAFAEGVPLDVRDADAVMQLFARVRPRCVIHTAYDKTRADVIVEGSANIARAAHAHGARLVHLSTDVVFSGARGRYREDDTPDPITEYGKAKHAAEQQVAAAAPEAVLVRTSLIYTRSGIDPPSQFVLDGILNHRPVPLFTDEYRNPILVNDLARALLELLALDVRGPLHVVGAERLNRYAFGQLIARYHHYQSDQLQPTTPEAVGMLRPKDCSLDSAKARALLRTPLRGASEVLDAAHAHPASG